MGANYYDDEDDEDYVPSMGRNKYDDSNYDETSFDFDADETSEDDVVSMCMVSRLIRSYLGLFWRNLVMECNILGNLGMLR
jgi:hypothetical protein